MRRQLTAREWMLLALLGIILVVCGYILLFYMPMTNERDRCISETESCRTQTEALQLRLEDKYRMERELKELFEQEVPPLSLAPYDNLQPVMFELNTVLSGTQNYSLSFASLDASQSIIRRSIALSFTAESYAAAKAVLQQLHDSAYRCMLDSVSLGMGQGQGDGNVSVSGTIVYFEYQ